MTLDDLRCLTGGATGVADVACPECGPGRKSPHNRTRKVMRVWDDGGDFATYHCQRCGIKGYAKEKGGATTVKRQPRPTPPASAAAKVVDDKSDLARDLWMRSAKAKDTLAETYMRSRHCWIESENIRYLPSRGRHAPTMIARFGKGSSLTGVHLTRLAPDGNGKAGTEKDKIMLGPSKGQPIIVHSAEGDDLIIAEGIEDAASWAIASGWTSWAAGSAGRIPAVIAQAQDFERIYISLDWDDAGLKAIEEARVIRPDLIRVEFDKVFNSADANKIMIGHGGDTLLGVLCRSRVLQDFRTGKIGRSRLQRELENCGNV